MTRLLTVNEFCKIVGISRTTLFRHRQAGKLSVIKVGTRVRFTEAMVEEYLRSCIEVRPADNQ